MPSTEIMIEPNGLKIKTFSELAEDLESKPLLPSFLDNYLRICCSTSQ